MRRTASFFTHTRATPSLSASRGASISGVKPVSSDATGSPRTAGTRDTATSTAAAPRSSRDRCAATPDRAAERPEAVLADRHRRRFVLGAAQLAALRIGRTRRLARRRARAGVGKDRGHCVRLASRKPEGQLCQQPASIANRRSVLRNRRIDTSSLHRRSAGQVPDLLEPRRLELPHRLALRPPILHVTTMSRALSKEESDSVNAPSGTSRAPGCARSPTRAARARRSGRSRRAAASPPAPTG